MNSQKANKRLFPSFRRKPESRFFEHLKNVWTPVFTGVTISYEAVEIERANKNLITEISHSSQVNLLFAQSVYPRIPLMRIVIIRPAALGDTLMLAPALFNSSAWGEVVVAGRKPGIDFLRPLVSGCLDFEGPGWHVLFVDPPEPDVSLPVKKADKIIAFLNDPQGSIRRNLERFFSSASIAVLPGYPDEKEAVHVALYLARALQNNGLPVDAEKALENAIKRPLLLSDHRSRLEIVFHPGSGGPQKNHAPEFWLELVRVFRERISTNNNKTPVILLGPAEEKLLPLFFREKGVEILFSPDLSIVSLLLQQALLYVGHDSGITHLAAMLGAPTIALFRHTSVVQWRPLGPRVKVIQKSQDGLELVEETLKAADGFLNESAGLW